MAIPSHNRRPRRVATAIALALLSAAVCGLLGARAAAPLTAAQQGTPDCPCSIWRDAAPDAQTGNDGQPVEVGVRFRSDLDGYITALRFYKAPGATGRHVGNLWTATGRNLASAVFANESESGWQEVTLTAPVRISANTTYIASYHSASGRYAVTPGFFEGASSVNPPLKALADGFDGANGLFKHGASGFPTETHRSANYWVDVVFVTTATDRLPPSVTTQVPADGATDVVTSTTITALFSEEISADSITVTLRQGDVTVPATPRYDAESRTVSVVPGAPLQEGTTYTVSISAADRAGNRMPEPVVWRFTTVAAAPPPPAVTPDPPARVPVTVTITLDRGPGATYYRGEQMVICIFVSRALPVRVTVQGSGASEDGGLLFDGVMGGTRCWQRGVSAGALGPGSVRVEAFEGGQVAASAEVGFTLADIDVVDPPRLPTGGDR